MKGVSPKAAFAAGFATTAAPLIAFAEDLDVDINVPEVAAVATQAASTASAVDQGTLIGYGAGLVACVVSLAVGFAIGYGTLVKP